MQLMRFELSLLHEIHDPSDAGERERAIRHDRHRRMKLEPRIGWQLRRMPHIDRCKQSQWLNQKNKRRRERTHQRKPICRPNHHVEQRNRPREKDQDFKQIVETMRSCRSTGCVTLKSRRILGNQAFTCTPAKKSLKLFSIMNTKRLILAIVVAFVVLWVTDFLVHGVWMVPDYRGTQQLWRTDAAMGSRISWMLGAQLLFAITFVLLWTRWAEPARLGCAIGYGFLMGLFSGTWAIIMFVVVPMPGSIAAKWFFAGILQTILLGLVTFFVYKPKSAPVKM